MPYELNPQEVFLRCLRESNSKFDNGEVLSRHLREMADILEVCLERVDALLDEGRSSISLSNSLQSLLSECETLISFLDTCFDKAGVCVIDTPFSILLTLTFNASMII